MASSGPSQSDIDMLTSICLVTRSQAITLLKKYSTSEQAISSYFDDPVGAVKEQAAANQWEPADNLPAFRIDADDSLNLPTMSRPPSRVESRGNFDAATGVGGQFNQQDDTQDSDLQRAIAMSKEESLSAQESGITQSGQHFGPANRSHYDPSQWAMTATSSSREIIEHPPPSKRRRLSGQPNFLRGSPETDYLAPLLNIYHSVPLAREAFMLPSFQVLSYGYDPTWWMGTSDENSKSISIQVSENGNQDRYNFLAELQSLMAFLDGSERAYGSVNALADLDILRNFASEGPISLLLEAWMAASLQQDPDEQLTQIFASSATKDPHTPGFSNEKKEFLCLDAPVNPLLKQNLVDLLDSTIWHDNVDNIDDVWMDYCSEVFTMRLHDPQRSGHGLGLEVPAIWYPDRYMYNYREASKQMRMQLVELRKEISYCSLVQRRCESAQAPDKRIINIREVLQAASRLSATSMPNGESSTMAPTDKATEIPTGLNETHYNLEAQLQAILKRVDEKIQVLEQRKLDIVSKMREISEGLTQPSSDPELTPKMKYVLQGVSTKPYITYVRHRRFDPSDLIEFEEDTGTQQDWQWWRLSWHQVGSDRFPEVVPNTEQTQPINDSSQPYSVRRVSESSVLEAAKSEHDSVLLVYARQSALDFVPSHASPALTHFIKQDNIAFRRELENEEIADRRPQSISTNTTIMDDQPSEQDGFVLGDSREMTPMSTTSPPRGEDGQPSPKRPRSDEAYLPRHSLDDDDPPPYEPLHDDGHMQEIKANKIGLIADRMLDKVDTENRSMSESTEGPVHIEHAKEPLR